MMDLSGGGGKKGGGQGFRVAKTQQQVPVIKSKEKTRLILFVVTVALAIVAAIVYNAPRPTVEEQLDDLVIDQPYGEVERPDLTQLPALPDGPAADSAAAALLEDLDAGEADAAETLRNHLSMAGVDDAIAFGWFRGMLIRDQAKPPTPRGFAAEDLLRGRFGRSDPIFISGNLVELVEVDVGGERWYHCCLEVPNHHQDMYIYVLVPFDGTPDAKAEGPEDKLAIGAEVRVTGRYLGPRSLPTASGERARMPAIAARTLIELDDTKLGDQSITRLLNIGGKDSLADDRPDAWSKDPSIYDEIDDQLPVLELRPYYYQLGLARVDSSSPSVYDDAADGLTESFNIHLDPEAYRGKIFTLDGIVRDAWVDQMVARDRPYDIRLVHRIRFYKRLFNVEHDEVDKLGRVTRTKRSTWHAYEVAALPQPGQELPRRGDTISFTGRFLKVRGYPVDKHPMEDMKYNIRRQSDKAWFKLFTTFAYESEPPTEPVDFSVFGWSSLVLGLSFVICMAILMGREDADADRYKRHMKKIRRGRRNLQQSVREAIAVEGTLGVEESDDQADVIARAVEADVEPGSIEDDKSES